MSSKQAPENKYYSLAFQSTRSEFQGNYIYFVYNPVGKPNSTNGLKR